MEFKNLGVLVEMRHDGNLLPFSLILPLLLTLTMLPLHIEKIDRAYR